MTPLERRQLLAAVDAEAARQARIREALAASLARLWRSLANPYDASQVAAWSSSVGSVTTVARVQAAGAADGYLVAVLSLLGASSRGRGKPPVKEPRGIPLAEEWARVPAEFRYQRALGTDERDASDRALRRAETIGDLDLQTARRDAFHDRLVSAEDVTGWRRVVHPELSAGGTCGLCIAASDRLYKTDDLAEIHAECKCTVLPTVGDQPDAGHALNTESLQRLYEEAGGTAAAKLKRTRYRVVQHGELGALLVGGDDDFRGPADVARAAA